MKTFSYLIILILLSVSCGAKAQKNEPVFPVAGFCIAAPRSVEFNDFLKFIDEELPSHSINTLILRVDYNYRYKSHPELSDTTAMTEKQVKELVSTCSGHNIKIIPEIDLLGHQSWAGTTGKLLEVYPEFDETPWVKMPEKYVWPNADKLYCKSYCPLHPKVHGIIFDLIDELCEAFGSDAFHAGMDEVFYIGEDKCPRCSGMDKADLFAGEVKAIHDHLALHGRTLWIWGDRLLDGKTTGMGEWEASMNNTYRAIDMIPNDIVICDWHYERPDQSAVYFAMKGFRVVSCPWRNAESAVSQAKDIQKFRNSSTPEMKERFLGVVQTIWSGAGQFIESYYGRTPDKNDNGQAECFRKLFSETEKLPK